MERHTIMTTSTGSIANTPYAGLFDNTTVSNIISDVANNIHIGGYTIDYSDNGTVELSYNKPDEKKKPDVREDAKNKLDIRNNKIYVKYYNEGFYKSEKCIMSDIKDVKVCDHTVIVMFADGTKTKAVLDPEDKFNLEQGISICITKKLLGEGGNAIYNKLISRALKINKQNEDAVKQAEEKKAERQRRKKAAAARKEKRRLKKREEQIAIQREAYIQAMEYLNKNKE